MATPDSLHRSDSGSSVNRIDPDALSISHQAALWAYGGLALETCSAEYRYQEGSYNVQEARGAPRS